MNQVSKELALNSQNFSNKETSGKTSKIIWIIQIIVLIYYNIYFFIYLLVGAHFIDYGGYLYIIVGIYGVFAEIGFLIAFFLNRRNYFETPVAHKDQSNIRSKRQNNFHDQFVNQESMPNVWEVLKWISDKIFIGYKVLLVLSLNGLFIYHWIFSLTWPEYTDGFLILATTAGIIIENFLLFLKYIDKRTITRRNKLFNVIIAIGSFFAFVFLMLYGFIDHTFKWFFLGLSALIIGFLVLIAKHNKFLITGVLLNTQHNSKLSSSKKMEVKDEKRLSQDNDTFYSSQENGLQSEIAKKGEFGYLKTLILAKESNHTLFPSINQKLRRNLLIVLGILLNLISWMIFIYGYDESSYNDSGILPMFLVIVFWICELSYLFSRKRVIRIIKLHLSKIFLKTSFRQAKRAESFTKMSMFKRARRKWKKVVVFYRLACKSTPEFITSTFIRKILLLEKKRYGLSFLSESISYSKRAWKKYQTKNYPQAVQYYRMAIQSVENGIKYLEKQEREVFEFGFPIKIALLYDVLEIYQMIIPQIELERKYQKSKNLSQNNLDLQEIFDHIHHALLQLHDNLQIYNQTFLLEEKYMDNYEIVKLFDSKLTMAITNFEELHQRLTNLIQYLHALEDQGIQTQDTNSFLKINLKSLTESKVDGKVAIEEPKSKSENLQKANPLQHSDSQIQIIREYEYIGGKIRFKVGLVNESSNIVTNLALRFDLPTSLKWIIHEPDYIRRGDTILIPKLGSKEKIAISLYLEPLNCMKSAINATLTYFNFQDHPKAVIMPSKIVTISCPIFFTREDANLARVKSLQQKLKYSDKKIFPIPQVENEEILFHHLLEVIGKHDVKLVNQSFSLDNHHGYAWYYGITKVKKDKMIIYLSMQSNRHFLEVNVYGDNQEPITGLLAEFEGQIREKLLMRKVISDGNAFNDINTSVLLGHCPYCNGPIASEWINIYKKGETIQCKYCDTSIIPY